MSAGRAARWAPALAVAVACNGVAAGVWKQAAVGAATFCSWYVLGKALFVTALWIGRRPPRRDRAWRAFVRVALGAALLNGVAWIAYLVALERGPLPMVQTITAAYGAVAAVLAVLFLGERLGRGPALGVGLVVVAGMGLAYAGEAPTVGARGAGWLAASFAAAGAWGASMVLCKRAFDAPGAEPRGFFLAHGLGLAVTLLPYGLLRTLRGGPDAAGGGAAALAVAALYLAGEVALFVALARGPASVVNPLSGLYPVATLAYAALVLGEVPDRRSLLAIAMILPGIVLTGNATGRRNAPRTDPKG